MYNSQSSFIVIWDQPVTSKFLELLTIGIRNIVIAPITPQAVLAEVNKSVYQLSLLQQVMIQQELLQMMFDFQNDLLFIVEDDEIVDCNTNFLRFFGYEDLFSYHEHHIIFAEHFVQENGYYAASHDITWLDDCLSQARKIKMYDDAGKSLSFYCELLLYQKICPGLLLSVRILLNWMKYIKSKNVLRQWIL